jgi:uncharacterized membrane protein YfcA
MTITAVILALGLGFGMGILGGGGSIVAVPALTFAMHFAPKDAVAISLAVVGLAAAAGAAGSYLRGVLPIGMAITVGLSAMAGAVAGAAIGAGLADRVQLSILAIVMIAAAIAMWRPAAIVPRITRHGLPFLVAIGGSIGVLTGLVGVGGGFLIVPALVIGAGVPLPKAVATSLFVIMLSTVAALPNYAGHTTLNWSFIAPFALVASLAAIAGGIVAHRLPQRRLQQAFAVTLGILATYVLVKA